MRCPDGFIVDQQRVLDVTLSHIPGDGANALGTQGVGGHATDRHVHWLTAQAGVEQGGRQHGLQGDHAGAVFKPRGHAGNQAAAAHAHQHAVRQAGLRLNLAGQGAGARGDLDLVVSVHQQGAALALALKAGFKRLRIGGTGHHHVRTQIAQAGPLGLRRHLGHKHLAAHAQAPGRRRRGNAGVAA